MSSIEVIRDITKLTRCPTCAKPLKRKITLYPDDIPDSATYYKSCNTGSIRLGHTKIKYVDDTFTSVLSSKLDLYHGIDESDVIIQFTIDNNYVEKSTVLLMRRHFTLDELSKNFVNNPVSKISLPLVQWDYSTKDKLITKLKTILVFS